VKKIPQRETENLLHASEEAVRNINVEEIM